jgi:hypothetical protein
MTPDMMGLSPWALARCEQRARQAAKCRGPLRRWRGHRTPPARRTGSASGNWPPPLEANYQGRATEIGLFLDLGGPDRYLERDGKTGRETASAVFKDGVRLLRPADPAVGDRRHFGIFQDGEGDVEAIRWFRRGVK